MQWYEALEALGIDLKGAKTANIEKNYRRRALDVFIANGSNDQSEAYVDAIKALNIAKEYLTQNYDEVIKEIDSRVPEKPVIPPTRIVLKRPITAVKIPAKMQVLTQSELLEDQLINYTKPSTQRTDGLEALRRYREHSYA